MLLALQSPPPDRPCFSTLAVAHRRLGPISSASISITVRFSPSWVSQERCCRRPTTITFAPRVSDSATFSASVRHALTVKYDVSPSFHSPDWSLYRRLTATRNLATAAPLGVYRSSGSSVRLPTIVTCPIAISTTTFSPTRPRPAMAYRARGEAPSGRSRRRLVDHLEPDHVVREVQDPLELHERCGVCLEVGDQVVALGLLGDLVCEPPAAPPVQLSD